jgi:exopolyphosphatase / guanosine-5'-triphosphate,3'-diphosphate pyrophosphatase
VRVAVVDLGTNSTRLLVADVDDGRVRELDRRTRVTRLGRGVDLTGQLSQEGMAEVAETVGEYLAAAEAHAPHERIAFATSAVRDASNGDAFVAELRERFALSARILDGLEEAALTYRGATSQRQHAAGLQAVVDIGGGSTEVVIGEDEAIGFHCSIQAGVVRQTERHLTSDPPDASELEALADDVRGLLRAGLDAEPGADRGIAVAGTPKALAAIDLELDPYDPARVHEHELEFDRIQRMLSELASMPLAERARVTGLHPRRAPTIVAGTIILIEALRALGLERVEVSVNDILHGAALAAGRG